MLFKIIKVKICWDTHDFNRSISSAVSVLAASVPHPSNVLKAIEYPNGIMGESNIFFFSESLFARAKHESADAPIVPNSVHGSVGPRGRIIAGVTVSKS